MRGPRGYLYRPFCEGHDVGSWHFSAVPTAPSNVGYWGDRPTYAQGEFFAF